MYEAVIACMSHGIAFELLSESHYRWPNASRGGCCTRRNRMGSDDLGGESFRLPRDVFRQVQTNCEPTYECAVVESMKSE